MIKNFNYKIIASVLILFLLYILMEFFIKNIKDDRYSKIATQDINYIQTLIKEKQNTTDIIALSISNNQLLKEALLENNPDKIDIEYYSEQLRKSSDFKNVWFQIEDSEGKSFKRSWTPKRGDPLRNIRIDIDLMLKNPGIISNISTGKFDMTFKSMVPVFHEGKLIGIFEVITHFNSIARKLRANGIESVFLVDKIYKKQLTKAFSKLFVKDYYVANMNAKPVLLDYLKKQQLELFLDFEKNYKVDIDNNLLIVKYNLFDKLGRKMGHMLLFHNLSDIKTPAIGTIRMVFAFFAVIVVLFLLILNLYLVNTRNGEIIEKKNRKLSRLNEKHIQKISELQKQRDKTDKIFNTQPTITIITDGKVIRDANRSFLDFFDRFDSLSDFMLKYDCICDLFEKTSLENYISERVIDSMSWIDYVIENKSTLYKVIMKKYGKDHHFIVNANRSDHIEENGKYLIVVSFLDITDEVRLHNDLRQKDKMLMQQSKLASMGEMMGNIAHQWRQPLNVISTSASFLYLEDPENLSREEVQKYLDAILKNTDYLSRTIDDFKEYFKPDKKSKFFDVKNSIEKALFLVSLKYKKHEIEVISNIESFEINGYENELIQVILNIFNNAFDVLKLNKEQKKLIFIHMHKDKEKLLISIKDNGGGVQKEIIDRIFEPYFSTKHQSQGTGIGLYMAEEMVVKHMKGSLDVNNSLFDFEGKQYLGAEFIISLPLSV